MKTNTYINTLNATTQDNIKQLLISKGVKNIDDAMHSRICDLEEIISFEEIQQLEKVGK